MSRSKALLVTAGLLAACLVGSGVASAAGGSTGAGDPPRVWSLDSDLAANARSDAPGNPFGDAYGHVRVWSLMSTPLGSVTHRPRVYRLLRTFHPNAATCGVPSIVSWSNSAGAPVVFMNLSNQTYHGTTCGPGQVLRPSATYVHPSNAPAAVVIGWKAQVAGTYTITGGVADADCSGGNGVRWFVDLQAVDIDGGTIDNCGTARFKAGLTATVRRGESLYFIVDPNGEWTSDATRVKVTITATA